MKYRVLLTLLLCFLLIHPCLGKGIISTAPNITEILISLGLGDQIAGITDYCPIPNKSAVSIGNINLDHEKILLIDPDIIFGIKGFNSSLSRLEKYTSKIKYLKFDSIDQITQSIRTIMKTRNLEGGHPLLDRFQSLSPVTDKPCKIFIQIWDNPFITVGKRSFLTDFLNKLGLTNIFRDVDRSFFEVSSEEILRRDPGLIIISQDKVPDKSPYKTGLLRFLSAVKNNRLIQLNPDLFLRPGPGLLKTIPVLKKSLNENEK